MNKEELKRRVSTRINLTEEAWAFFLEKRYDEDALGKDNYEDAVNFIIEEYHKHKAAFGGTRGRRQTRDQEISEVPVSLRESELERRAASEEYAAFRAARDGGTRWFRNRVLGDRLLTAEQARELMRSPAARFLEASSFEFAGGDIPLIGHRANLEYCLPVKYGDREVGHRARVSVDPPGITETVDNMFSEAPQRAPKKRRFNDGTYGQGVHYVNEGGRASTVSVWEWSLLGHLRGLSEELAQTYRWEPAQSTMFILTGEIPAVPPLKVGISWKSTKQLYPATTSVPTHLDATIIIMASPWVPTRTVASNYREAQIKILGSSGGKPPSERNLTLFRFVLERIQSLSEPAAEAIASRAPGHAKMPEGKELVSEWKEAYPQWAKTEAGDLITTRRFWRDFKRILKTIAVGPPYRLRPRAATDRRSR